MVGEPPADELRKYYVDGGQVEDTAQVIYDLEPRESNAHGPITKYAARRTRPLYPSRRFTQTWTHLTERGQVIPPLKSTALISGPGRADRPSRGRSFDLFCHFAFNAPLEPAQKAERHGRKEGVSRQMALRPANLNDLLDKYANTAMTQLAIPDVLHVPPISDHGNPTEILGNFGGVDEFRGQ